MSSRPSTASGSRVLGDGDLDDERHLVPGAAVRDRRRYGGPAGHPATVAAPRLGADESRDGPDRLAAVITELGGEDGRFHVDGGSWTNNVSWVRGYDDVLNPMQRVSALFHERVSRA